MTVSPKRNNVDMILVSFSAYPHFTTGKSVNLPFQF